MKKTVLKTRGFMRVLKPKIRRVLKLPRLKRAVLAKTTSLAKDSR